MGKPDETDGVKKKTRDKKGVEKSKLKVKCPKCGSEDIDNMDVVDSDGECVDGEVIESVQCHCECTFDVKFKTTVVEITCTD